MAWINSHQAYEMFGYEIGRSIMAYAYRNSNTKKMKKRDGSSRVDPIAHYNVEELLEKMSVSIHSRHGNFKAYWKEDFDSIKSKLEGLLYEDMQQLQS